jgi:hypothetical protein
MGMPEPAYLRRTPATAARVREILGLPNDAWNDVDISFGNDGVAQARISLFLTPDQVVQLAVLTGGRHADLAPQVVCPKNRIIEFGPIPETGILVLPPEP